MHSLRVQIVGSQENSRVQESNPIHKKTIVITLSKFVTSLGRGLLNTEVFVPNLQHAEKVDLCKSYWNPQRKLGVATLFFDR